MAITVDDITRLAALVTRERLDSLRWDGISVTIAKSVHATDQAKPLTAAALDDDDDDLLYHSSDT